MGNWGYNPTYKRYNLQLMIPFIAGGGPPCIGLPASFYLQKPTKDMIHSAGEHGRCSGRSAVGGGHRVPTDCWWQVESGCGDSQVI